MSDDPNRRDQPHGLEAALRHRSALKGVNERLREVTESLRSAQERYRAGLRPGPSPQPAAAPITPPQRALEAELATAREALERARAREESLLARLVDAEGANRRLGGEYVIVEQHASHLAALYVALERLHASLDHAAVLDAIQEIVVNIVGSEEFGLYELAPDRSALHLARGVGLVGRRPDTILVGDGPIGRVAAGGPSFFAGGDGSSEDPDLTVCVPLRLGTAVTGVLAIWGLLGHKPELVDLDVRVLELLTSHASAAIRAAALEREARARNS